MLFKELFIKNFRSVGPDGLTITFQKERNLALLLGPNGSGKSNILTALGYVLGFYPFNKFEPEEQDFFRCGSDEEMVIELRFYDPLKTNDVYQKEFEIHGFRYRVWRKTTGQGKGILSKEHYCIDEGGHIITKSQRLYKKPKEGEEIDNTKLPVSVKDQAWQLGDAFFMDASGLERFFSKTTGWGPVGRLFELYRDDFPADRNKFALRPDEIVPSREALDRLSKKLCEILRTPKLQDIEKGLSRHFKEYLGKKRSELFRVEFALPTHRDLFEDLAAFRVATSDDLPPLAVDRLGAGYRALLRLAVLETLLELSDKEKNFILLIEEPESYLHVHLKRYFSHVLRKLAKKGHQVVFTTHSPEFADLSEPYDVIRVTLGSGEETCVHQVTSSVALDFEKAKRKLRRLGNEELLFASHVFLTEGQDDQALVEWLLEERGVDQDANSISVIQCDGVENLPDYIGLCATLGIDFYVIHDEDDITNKSIQDRNAKIREAVEIVNPHRPSLCTFSPYLEAELGLQKHCGLAAIQEHLGKTSYEALARNYPTVVKPIQEFLESRGLAPSLVPVEVATP